MSLSTQHTPDLSLAKNKKLVGKLRVQRVFTEGESSIAFPIRACVLRIQTIEKGEVREPIQVLFSVSKRMFKRAVKRNRLKRLMREAYRLHQQDLLDHCGQTNAQIEVAFLYISNKEVDFATMEKAMLKAIRKIKASL